MSNKLPFDYVEFMGLSVERNDKIFNDPNPDPLYMAVCISEEAGEVAGAIKKLHRGFNKREFEKTKKKHLEWLESTDKIDDANALREFSYDDAHQAGVIKVIWTANHLKKIGSEMADIFIYTTLYAAKLGINLGEEVKEKFNKVSKEMGAPEYRI